MRKQELIHMNQLCAEIGNDMQDRHDLEEDWLSDVYDMTGVSGFHDFRAAKSDQHDALFSLVGEITRVIEHEIDDAEDETELTERTSRLTA